MLRPGDARLAHTYTTLGVHYEYSVEWVQDCTTFEEAQNVYKPTGSASLEANCLGLWTSCSKKCMWISNSSTIQQSNLHSCRREWWCRRLGHSWLSQIYLHWR